MEEKKLTDEVVVAKNAITDEEIAKAILQQIEYNAGIPYIDEWLKVKTIKFTDILNFIHRLQSRNEKAIKDYYAALQTCDEQKAEIERLTEREKFLENAWNTALECTETVENCEDCGEKHLNNTPSVNPEDYVGGGK